VRREVSVSWACLGLLPGPGPGEALAWNGVPGGLSSSGLAHSR